LDELYLFLPFVDKNFYFSGVDQSCSTDCVGESCQSVLNLDGVCVITSATTISICEAHENGVMWYNNSICVNQSAIDYESCTQVTDTQFISFHFHGRFFNEIFLHQCDVFVNLPVAFFGMDHLFFVRHSSMWKWLSCPKVSGVLCQSLAPLFKPGSIIDYIVFL
jgi:hypothetical protein